MQNENRLVPDFRTETIEEITETYTPEGGTEQIATYKIGSAHPIIGGILDKFTWIRTHAAAVWWNALERVTLRDKITAMDEQIAQLNGNSEYEAFDVTLTEGAEGVSVSAFRCNGVTSISFLLNAGAKSVIRFSVPVKFRPIYTVSGSFSCTSTDRDSGKCAGVTLSSSGIGFIWILTPLEGNCYASIVYPSSNNQS